MKGIFTISLDFELHWGVFDKKDRLNRTTCYQNTLKLIPELLRLFEKHKVNVTWATVGGVFAKDRSEWEKLKPATEPEYVAEKYSAYKWVDRHGLPENLYFAHFAPDAIENILQFPGQELGTHTFGHYYCLEEQKDYEAFDADLKAVKKTALKFNTKPISLVFPRNQFNDECLRICYNNGIKVIRSNPSSWFWEPIADGKPQLLRKIARTGDAYVKLGGRTSYPLNSISIKKNTPIQLPASRLFRPWNSRYRLSNKLSLQRILNELKSAAIHEECYHLWWHPENFGDHPEENLNNLKVILKEYENCRTKYGMTSWNMGEFAKHLL
jgi:peptidoglycan/xylan/chitin deacetylase (PgdA/CDA1 family)